MSSITNFDFENSDQKEEPRRRHSCVLTSMFRHAIFPFHRRKGSQQLLILILLIIVQSTTFLIKSTEAANLWKDSHHQPKMNHHHPHSQSVSDATAASFDHSRFSNHGNNSTEDYFKLLVQDGGSLLVGGRNMIYNISLPSLISLQLKNLTIRIQSPSSQDLVASSSFLSPQRHSLEYLDLGFNSMSKLPDDLFCPLTNLKLLNLTRNRLSGFASLGLVDHSTGNLCLQELQYLDLSFNQIRFLSETGVASLKNLRALYLNHNHINQVAELSLSALSKLNTIDLSHNHISTIPSRLFRDSSQLRHLFLQNNSIYQLPADLFKGLSKLFVLDLSFNLISSISNTSYQGIENLYSLNLEGNRIGNLSKGVFSHLPSLKVLILSRNKIAGIAQGTFDDVPDLHALRLDSNQISDINGLFGNLRDLVMLNISVNRISWFDYAFIPVNLQWLDIHYNNIESLGNYYEMQAVLKLKSLDCSHNKIKEIESSSFPDGIDMIQLSFNSLKKISPFTFMGKQNLTRVDVTENHLESLDSNSFRLSNTRLHRQLPEFKISKNPYSCDCNMEWLKQVLIDDESKQYPRIVDGNSVRCHMTFEGNFNVNNANYKKNSSTIAMPTQQQTVSSMIPVKDVPSSSFLCQYKSHCFALCHCCDFDACDCEMQCPDNCSCFHDSTWNTNIVDCSTKGYHAIPSGIPMDVTELYVDGNDFAQLSSHAFIGRKNMKVLHMNNSGIQVINNRTFNGIKNLQVLNLNHNQLTKLQGDEFERLFDLKELYLSFNKISYIANNTFTGMRSLKVLHLDHNAIMEFSVWTLAVNTRLMEVTLSQNLWSCECKFLRQYTSWLSETRDIVADSRQILCFYNSTSSMSVLSPDINVSSCASVSARNVPYPPATSWSSSGSSSSNSSHDLLPDYLPVMVITGCVFLLLVMSMIILGVYRKEVSIWLYSRYGVRLQGRHSASREEEKLFDCFISYSKMDESFVTQILAPELEYGNPPFRLCLHYRDLPVASGYLSDAIVEAVQASRRSILVISENFLKNEWCRYEFKSAHLEVLRTNQRQNLILVFIGKINAADFDPDIRFWLKRSTFLQWGEKMFWQKLRYAMPDLSSLDAKRIYINGTTTTTLRQ